MSPVIHQRSGTPKRIKLQSVTAVVETETEGSGGDLQDGTDKAVAVLMQDVKILQQQLEEKKEKLRKLKMAKMYRAKVSNGSVSERLCGGHTILTL